MSAYPIPATVPQFGTLQEWDTITYYPLDWRTLANGNIYQVITAGTSDNVGTGPSGTGADITDGTVHWEFIAHASPAWVTLTPYITGAIVTHDGGRLYECIAAGTTGAVGPTGTDGVIVDGTVTWSYTALVTAQQTPPTARVGDIGAIPGSPAFAGYANWWTNAVTTWLFYVRDFANQAWIFAGNLIFLGLATFKNIAYFFGAPSSSAANDLPPAIAFTDHTTGAGEPVNFKIAEDVGTSATRAAVYRTPRLADWAQSTAYSVGNRRTANGSNYEVTVMGTSSNMGTGPAGTGAAIVDGSVTWKYVAPAGAVVRVYNAQWLSDGAGGYHWVQYNAALPSFKEQENENGRESFYRAPGAGSWVDGSWIPTETFDSQTGNYATPGTVTGNAVVSSTSMAAGTSVTAGTTLVAQAARSSATGGAGQAVAAGEVWKDTAIFAWVKVVISGGAIASFRGANIASIVYTGAGVYTVTLQTAATNLLCPVVTVLDASGTSAYVDLGTPPTTTAFRVMLITTNGASTPTDPANGGGFFVTVMQG